MPEVLHIQIHVGSYCQLYATWVDFDYSYIVDELAYLKTI